jgi:hypothetical protein
LIAGQPFGQPRTTPIMPRVTMNGIMRKPAMTSAVDQPDQPAGQHSQYNRGGRGAAFDQQRRAQHAGQRHHRADAQINAAADNDHRHAQRAEATMTVWIKMILKLPPVKR